MTKFARKVEDLATCCYQWSMIVTFVYLVICCGSVLSLVQIINSLLFLGIVMYDYKFETKESKIWTKDKIEPQYIHGWNVNSSTHLSDQDKNLF